MNKNYTAIKLFFVNFEEKTICDLLFENAKKHIENFNKDAIKYDYNNSIIDWQIIENKEKQAFELIAYFDIFIEDEIFDEVTNKIPSQTFMDVIRFLLKKDDNCSK